MRTPHGFVHRQYSLWKLTCIRACSRPVHARLAHAKCAPRIVFSVPVDENVDTRPDCYRVHKVWCPEAEAELEDVLAFRLSLDPAATSKVIKYAKHYEANIYKNPARVLCRIESWLPLEAEFPGTDVRRLLALNPQLITYRASALRKKLTSLMGTFQLQDDTSKLARYTTRCSTLLTRSPQSVSKQLQLLQSCLGADVAPGVIARYPELLSRNASALVAAFQELTQALGGNAYTAQRMVNSNPALLKQRNFAERLERLASTVKISTEDAARVAQAVPTILNISTPTLQRRTRLVAAGLQAWAVAPEDLMPSVFGRLMTASDARLARLRYISFLHTRPVPTAPRPPAADARGQAVAAAATAVARAAAAIAAATAQSTRPGRQRHAEPGKPRAARSPALRKVSFGKVGSGDERGGKGSERAIRRLRQGGTGTGQAEGRAVAMPQKRPITILNMKDDEFKKMYPRFERWYRRQSRNSSVGVQQR